MDVEFKRQFGNLDRHKQLDGTIIEETKLLHECLSIAHEYKTALINGNDYMKKEVNKMHKDLKDRNIT